MMEKSEKLGLGGYICFSGSSLLCVSHSAFFPPKYCYPKEEKKGGNRRQTAKKNQHRNNIKAKS
jgi:hypothetical protein